MHLNLRSQEFGINFTSLTEVSAVEDLSFLKTSTEQAIIINGFVSTLKGISVNTRQ